MTLNKRYLLASILVFILIMCVFFIYRYNEEAAAFRSGVRVTVEKVIPEEVRVTYTRLQLSISIYNPTDETIDDFSSAYDIYIANTPVGSGSIDKLSLPAKTTRTSTSTIIIYYAQVADGVVDALTHQNYDLTVSGTIEGKIFFNLLPISEEFSAVYRA